MTELSAKVRTIKKAHEERIGNEISDISAEYDLTNLRPGDKEHSMAYRPDPDFFDKNNVNRIQLITVLFSNGKRAGGPEWMKRAQDNFDFGALAALLN